MSKNELFIYLLVIIIFIIVINSNIFKEKFNILLPNKSFSLVDQNTGNNLVFIGKILFFDNTLPYNFGVSNKYYNSDPILLSTDGNYKFTLDYEQSILYIVPFENNLSTYPNIYYSIKEQMIYSYDLLDKRNVYVIINSNGNITWTRNKSEASTIIMYYK